MASRLSDKRVWIVGGLAAAVAGYYFTCGGSKNCPRSKW